MFSLGAHRIRTVLLVVLALLFSQLAVAGYVCPPGEGAAPAMMEMAPGEPCEGMAQDPDQPMLCHQHCNGAPQASDLVKLPVVSPPAIIHVVVLPVPLAAGEAAGVHAEQVEPHAPPEPVFLSTLRLRV